MYLPLLVFNLKILYSVVLLIVHNSVTDTIFTYENKNLPHKNVKQTLQSYIKIYR